MNDPTILIQVLVFVACALGIAFGTYGLFFKKPPPPPTVSERLAELVHETEHSLIDARLRLEEADARCMLLNERLLRLRAEQERAKQSVSFSERSYQQSAASTSDAVGGAS